MKSPLLIFEKGVCATIIERSGITKIYMTAGDKVDIFVKCNGNKIPIAISIPFKDAQEYVMQIHHILTNGGDCIPMYAEEEEDSE